MTSFSTALMLVGAFLAVAGVLFVILIGVIVYRYWKQRRGK